MKITERYRKLSFWNKVFFWAAVASFLSLIIGIVTLLVGSHQNVTMYNYFDKPFYKTEVFQQYLKGKYPLGYAVFASDGKTVNVPDGLTFERDFEIKWGNAKVFQLKSDMIYIDLPDIVYKPTGNVLTNIGFGFPRKVGYVTPLPLVNWKQSIPIIEVLADEGNFVVFVLGFIEKH
jgi:hypothetical protein